ncbi:MAG: hypothetical protein VXW58_13580, partial [Pseudomonadota bacterium]|nr:hypothetical protein [Pseudomonadota bacterium]
MKTSFFAAAALALLTTPAFAATVTTTAVADVTVGDEDFDGVMDYAGPQDDVYLRVFGNWRTGRGVLEYDLSGIAAGDTVDSASVSFSVRGTRVPGVVNLYGYSGDGVATIADGNLVQTLVGSFTVSDASADYNVSISSSFLQGLLDAGASHLGLIMVSSDETRFGPGADFCSVGSTNYSCSGIPGSQLTVNSSPANVVPVPASLPLLAGGFGLFGV